MIVRVASAALQHHVALPAARAVTRRCSVAIPARFYCIFNVHGEFSIRTGASGAVSGHDAAVDRVFHHVFPQHVFGTGGGLSSGFCRELVAR
jgi:hypothetical protein